MGAGAGLSVGGLLAIVCFIVVVVFLAFVLPNLLAPPIAPALASVPDAGPGGSVGPGTKSSRPSGAPSGSDGVADDAGTKKTVADVPVIEKLRWKFANSEDAKKWQNLEPESFDPENDLEDWATFEESDAPFERKVSSAADVRVHGGSTRIPRCDLC